MLHLKKQELRRVLNKQFIIGINKSNLLEAVEHFIDNNYEVPVSEYRSVLHDLVVDILACGGYEGWRTSLREEVTTSEIRKINTLLSKINPPEPETRVSKKD